MIAAKTPFIPPIPLRGAAAKIRLGAFRGELAELRLRAGRAAVAVSTDGTMLPCSEPFSAEEIAACFAELCRYSVYSYAGDIAEGFVTLDGGHRVGISGTAVTKDGRVEMIKDISSLNIRIAREVIGCAEPLHESVFSGGLCSLLLAGKPMSGKTTILRDLARILGKNHKVVLIDSRNELSATSKGTPTLDVGLNTDVLCGFSKSEGIMLALRSLSPQVIICDEIGNDSAAVEQCLFCGVKLIAAAHAGSLRELEQRTGVRDILPFFDKVRFIEGFRVSGS